MAEDVDTSPSHLELFDKLPSLQLETEKFSMVIAKEMSDIFNRSRMRTEKDIQQLKSLREKLRSRQADILHEDRNTGILKSPLEQLNPFSVDIENKIKKLEERLEEDKNTSSHYHEIQQRKHPGSFAASLSNWFSVKVNGAKAAIGKQIEDIRASLTTNPGSRTAPQKDHSALSEKDLGPNQSYEGDIREQAGAWQNMNEETDLKSFHVDSTITKEKIPWNDNDEAADSPSLTFESYEIIDTDKVDK